MSFYRQQLESWLSELDVKAKTVLDIGGGQGPVKGRTKSWDVFRYQIIDLPSQNLEGKWNPSNIIRADIIFCLEVFEYLIEPKKALRRIKNQLKDGGKAYVTFAFIYPHHNELEMDSLRYTEPGIQRLADAVGLKITNAWYRIDKSGLLQQFYAADGMRMAREYPNHNVTGFIVEMTK